MGPFHRHDQNKMTAASQMQATMNACSLKCTNGKLLRGCSPLNLGQTSWFKNVNIELADTHNGISHPAEKMATSARSIKSPRDMSQSPEQGIDQAACAMLICAGWNRFTARIPSTMNSAIT